MNTVAMVTLDLKVIKKRKLQPTYRGSLEAENKKTIFKKEKINHKTQCMLQIRLIKQTQALSIFLINNAD
jgi:uncharacterized protein YegP (UPF0339 family)